MEKTNIFHDLWCFIKKWYMIICCIILVVSGVVSIGNACIFFDAGDIQSAIFSCVDGYGQFILGVLVLILDVVFNRLSPAVPDENNKI